MCCDCFVRVVMYMYIATNPLIENLYNNILKFLWKDFEMALLRNFCTVDLFLCYTESCNRNRYSLACMIFLRA